ncbi:class I SAM-dependent methyltransferase [Microvirga sp. TS319]|uniref:class I SAM-dependent methyltransferase n=1 Tax=Microvirga sp. TS319 TaxID=3241165 RepID=UPI00351A8636
MAKKVDWSTIVTSDDLTADAKLLLPLPDGLGLRLNAYSMACYQPIFNELAAVFPPKAICEIGVSKAELSAILLDLAEKNNADLALVDPALAPEGRDWLEKHQSEGRIKLFESESISFLAKDAERFDYFFIDGDHNYQTVRDELRLIDAAKGKSPYIVLLHDVGWPCARRDMYYNKARIEERHPAQPGYLSPFEQEVCEFGIDYKIPVAIQEGGARNGVLTAVEDFIMQSDGAWRYYDVPLFFGLGLLWNTECFDEDKNQAILAIAESLMRWRTLFGTSELNRLMLLMRLQQSGLTWQSQQREIARLGEVIRVLRKKLSDQTAASF